MRAAKLRPSLVGQERCADVQGWGELCTPKAMGDPQLQAIYPLQDLGSAIQTGNLQILGN
jgi:hypothetical protein